MTAVLLNHLTVAEAAKRLGVTKPTIFSRIHSGKLRAIKVSPHFFLVPEDALDGFRRDPRGRRKVG
jgi:excisionase family DNA binding protein